MLLPVVVIHIRPPTSETSRAIVDSVSLRYGPLRVRFAGEEGARVRVESTWDGAELDRFD